jgi:O-antigen ligase
MVGGVARTAIGVALVVTFFANVPSFLYVTGRSAVTPNAWLFAFMALLAFATVPFLPSMPTPYRRLPLVLIWIALYLCMIGIWYLAFPQTAVSEDALRVHVAAIVFVIAAWLALYVAGVEDPELRKARWAILACTVAAVVINVFDVMNPFVLVPLGHERANPGRAAGLYVNANQAGSALILGIIVGVGLLQRYRVAFCLLVFAGVLLTFSRGAILGWLVVAIILLLRGVLTLRRLVIGTLAFAGLVTAGSILLLERVGMPDELNVQNIQDRIEFFAAAGSADDPALRSRVRVLNDGLEVFEASPLVGSGLGSSLSKTEGAGVHNTYVRFLAEHGIVGLAMLGGLFFALLWRTRGVAREIAIPLAGFLALWGVTSHNILEDYAFLTSCALVDLIAMRSGPVKGPLS